MVDNKKEIEPSTSGVERVVPPVEAPVQPAENLEVSSWMEKIEKKFARTPITPSDVASDAATPPQPPMQQPPVTLPVTQQQMIAGKKAKPNMGIAWLVTWAIRQMKLLARIGRKAQLQEK